MFTQPIPIPGINVTIRQISPFIPHSYNESSFPTCCFNIDVDNIDYNSSDIDVSIMFCLEKGYLVNNTICFEFEFDFLEHEK